MRYDSNSHITSIEDVKAFFGYMINDLDVNLHADTPFCEYVNLETGEPTFTEGECRLYDRLMQESFDICGKNGDEGLVYEILYVKAA